MTLDSNRPPDPGRTEPASVQPGRTPAGSGPQWNGPGGLKEVGRLAYPIVLTQISITTMGVVDSMIVGRLGAAPLGAVGLGGMWVWTLTSFFVGTSTGVQTFVAQQHGAGEAHSCGGWSWQGLASIVPLAAIAALVIGFGAHQIIAWIAPTETIAPLAGGYIRARSLGIVGITAAVSLSSFFRGIGDTRTPLYVTLIANAINLVLDFGLVFGLAGLPKLGVVGAGLATAISEWCYFAGMLIMFMRPALRRTFDTRFRWPDPEPIRRLWRIGVPIGGQWVLEMLSFALFTMIVARMGDAEMAASHVFVQLLSLSFMQATGISTAAATLVGQYIGAQRREIVDLSFASSVWLGGALGLLIAGLFVVFPEQLVGLFTSDPDVIALGRPLLLVGAVYQFLDALGIVADGALRGAGDTRVPFVARCLLSWFVFLPAAYVFAFPLGGGLQGAWVGGLFHISALAGFLFWRFRSGAWRHLSI